MFWPGRRRDERKSLWRGPTTGSAGYRVRSASCEVLEPRLCLSAVLQPAVVPPPTTSVIAIQSGATESGHLANGEIDEYSFTALANAGITATMASTDGLARPDLTLYAPNGTKLEENYTTGAGGSTELDTTATTAGTYYLVARDVYGGGSGGAYNVAVATAGAQGADSQGGAIASSQTVSGTLNGNLHVYTFTALANAGITATMASTDGTARPDLTLYAPNGTKLEENYTTGAGGTTELDTTGATAGTYYLVARDVYGGGGSGAYNVAVATAGAQGADSQGGAIASSQTVSGTLNGNLHVYTFTALANAGITATMASTDGLARPDLTLYAPNGTKLAENYTTGAGGSTELDTTATTAGTYYLVARDVYGGGAGGAYELSITGATAQIVAPTIDSPGNTTLPGPVLPSLTPTFTWNQGNGATGYGLYIRNLTTDALVYPNSSGATTSPLTGTSLTLPPGVLTAGDSYRWGMTSFGGNTESSQGSVLYFQAPAASSSLAAPTNVQANGGTSPAEIHINWDAVTGAQSYEVWRNTVDDPTSATEFPVDIVGTSYDDPTAQPGTSYYYWVTARNLSATSPFSASAIGEEPTGQLAISGSMIKTVSGFAQNQVVIIEGSGFTSNSTVTLTNPKTKKLYNEEVLAHDSQHLTIFPNFGTKAQKWTVTVSDPAAASSQQFTLNVIGPGKLSPTTPIGEFNGCTAFSNGKNHKNPAHQCVDYVERYYLQNYHTDLHALSGGLNGNEFFTNPDIGLDHFKNGTSSTPPQPGDILCFDGGPPDKNGNVDGHVAIVREVIPGVMVVAIQQNVADTYRDAAFSYKLSWGGGVYTVDALNRNGGSQLGQSYWCQGWLRFPGPT
jgi:hypothetical protein